MGRLLKRTKGFRLMANYKKDAVAIAAANMIVKQAKSFVAAILTKFNFSYGQSIIG